MTKLARRAIREGELMAEATPGDSKTRRGKSKVIPRISSLETVMGAHPDALRDIYGEGLPADPSRFDGSCDGRLLAIPRFVEAYALTRPLVTLVAKHLNPWRGQVFESGGTAGVNRLGSLHAFRFRCEASESHVDHKQTMTLHYDGFANPWPISRFVAELRTVGDGVAIGPAFYLAGPASKLVLWWGLAYSAGCSMDADDAFIAGADPTGDASVTFK